MSVISDIWRAPFAIGDIEINPLRNHIATGSGHRKIEPRIMDVLCVLAEADGEVVSRDTLIGRVWRRRHGVEESLTRAVSILRRVFREAGHEAPVIETIPTRGYRLAAPALWAAPPAPREEGPATHVVVAAEVESAPGPAQKPRRAAGGYSVGVLAFENLTPAATHGFLVDGVTRDLTTLLSRTPRLRVAAYSSAARFDASKRPVPEIAEALGARYLVSGSLAFANGHLRLRACLMDGPSNTQLWSQKIDEPLERFYAIQDKLALDISTSILASVQVAEAASIRRRKSFDLTAYELIQCAESLRAAYGREAAVKIAGYLGRALALDPEDAAVHASLAIQLTQNVVSGWAAPATFETARAHVARAMAIDPADPDVMTAAGIAATMMGDAESAVRHLTRAVGRDPNNAHAMAVLGWQLCWLDADPTGVELIETAEYRAPNHPRYPLWAYYRGHNWARLGENEKAVEAYRESADRNPNYHLCFISMASILAAQGRDGEAREAVSRARALMPEYRARDYDILVHRMTHMFADEAARDAAVKGLYRVWPR